MISHDLGRIDMSKSLINEAVLTQVINHLRKRPAQALCRDGDCGRRSRPSSNSPPS